uniref:Uncharacterized protein n=1 Tax=Arundo donax TaxID=35708 RepID=A0A0A9H6Q8_ARUDO
MTRLQMHTNTLTSLHFVLENEVNCNAKEHILIHSYDY